MQLGKGKSIKAKTYGSDEDFIRLKKNRWRTDWMETVLSYTHCLHAVSYRVFEEHNYVTLIKSSTRTYNSIAHTQSNNDFDCVLKTTDAIDLCLHREYLEVESHLLCKSKTSCFSVFFFEWFL